MVKIDSISEFANYRNEAHLKYEIIRPVLLGQITSRNRANELQLHEVTLAEYIKRFRKYGYAELLDQRHGPSKRKGQLSDAQKAYMVLNQIPFTNARIISQLPFHYSIIEKDDAYNQQLLYITSNI